MGYPLLSLFQKIKIVQAMHNVSDSDIRDCIGKDRYYNIEKEKADLPHGKYGSKYSSTSINNQYSNYGSKYSTENKTYNQVNSYGQVKEVEKVDVYKSMLDLD